MGVLDTWIANNLLSQGGILAKSLNLSTATPIPVLIQDPATTVKEDYRVYKEWDAPAWIPRKVTPELVQIGAALSIIVLVISIFLKDIVLFLVFVAVLVTLYLSTKLIPPTLHYKITTEGITSDDHKIYWRELDRFQLETRGEDKTLELISKNNTKFSLLLAREINLGSLKPILLKYIRES